MENHFNPPLGIIANGDFTVGYDSFEREYPGNSFLEQARYYQTSQRIKKSVAAHWNVDEEEIFIGNGVDDILNHIILNLSFAQQILTFWPAYPFVDQFAKNAHCHNIKVPLKDDGSYPLNLPESTFSYSPNMIIIINPSNTTGKTIDKLVFQKYLEQFPNSIFVIDESFIDYCKNNSLLPLAKKENRMIIIQGFSKGFCIPGIRLGMAYCKDKNLIKQLEKARMFMFTPYTIEAATWALSNTDYFEETIKLNMEIKNQMENRIKNIFGLTTKETETNFILVNYGDINPILLKKECEQHSLCFWWFNEHSIFLEYFGNPIQHPRLKNTFRVCPIHKNDVDKFGELLSTSVSNVLKHNR
jgi:histidinol-phosphate/aromatic aminotransferase/cobyric acid decarboxylase-like protein